jgi:uroporphyrinogen-III synthase
VNAGATRLVNHSVPPLAGRTVVVTRPARQANLLAEMIEAAGGVALRFPVIEIEPVRSRALAEVIARLESMDLALFISRNAVEQGLAVVRASREWPPGVAVAAVGAGTRSTLEAQGITGAFSPVGPADSEALLADPRLLAVSGKRIMIFRGEGGRDLLADTLRARGASVEYAECYRRLVPAADPATLIEGLSAGIVHGIVVSSGAGLANLLAMLGTGAAELLGQTRVFVPHRRVADAASAHGLNAAIVGGPADADMLAALVAYFSGTS